jgi:hypothetical protein
MSLTVEDVKGWHPYNVSYMKDFKQINVYICIQSSFIDTLAYHARTAEQYDTVPLFLALCSYWSANHLNQRDTTRFFILSTIREL